ncbi:MAG TPA: hypothetical protein VLA89_18925, partial [Gemmatimonadales bacterium]|nr:hypothetical protein [Gemmatimonadales bacterium]
ITGISPNVGFDYVIPAALADGKAHTMRVTLPGGAEMAGSPRSFTLVAPAPPPTPTESPLTSEELKKVRKVLGYFA